MKRNPLTVEYSIIPFQDKSDSIDLKMTDDIIVEWLQRQMESDMADSLFIFFISLALYLFVLVLLVEFKRFQGCEKKVLEFPKDFSLTKNEGKMEFQKMKDFFETILF